MPVLTAAAAPTHHLDGARFTSLATPARGSTETAVWRVEILPGAPAAPHSLTREEIFVVLDGTAWVRIGGREERAGSGDAVVVPPGVELDLGNAGSAPLTLVCCLPVGGQAQAAGAPPFTPPWAE
jgi:quercetin dioxygenase-like cupin family protein